MPTSEEMRPATFPLLLTCLGAGFLLLILTVIHHVLLPASVIEEAPLQEYTFEGGIHVGQSARIPRLDLDFLWCPPGRFMMGSHDPDDDVESPQHAVVLTRGFWLSRTEITQQQYAAIMGENPSFFVSAGPSAPVDSVTWPQAVACSEALQRALEDPLPGDYVMGLPTEAQWEYACRAGASPHSVLYPLSERPTFDTKDLSRLGDLAWFEGNSDSDQAEAVPATGRRRLGTHAVARKLPNAWGFYDMLGNVWEWCHDRRYERYFDGEQVDPEGLPVIGYGRSQRGGAWDSAADDSRVFDRDYGYEAGWSRTVGFRMAIRPRIQPKVHSRSPEAHPNLPPESNKRPDLVTLGMNPRTGPDPLEIKHQVDRYPVAVGEQLDFDGNGRGDLFQRAPTGEWLVSYGGETPWISLNESVTLSGEMDGLLFGDFDGDRKTDVLTSTQRDDGPCGWLISRGGKSPFKPWRSDTIYPVDRLRVVELDGDGMGDLFTIDTWEGRRARWLVYLAGSSQWRVNSGGGSSMKATRAGDVNGNGITDIIHLHSSKERVITWGVSLDARTRWQVLQEIPSPELHFLRNLDLDGNGKTDMFKVEDGEPFPTWQVSFDGVSPWTQLGSPRQGSLDDLYFTDLDGDDRTDVIQRIEGHLQVSYAGTSPWRRLKAITLPNDAEVVFGNNSRLTLSSTSL